jgi:hypothetical protein
VVIWETININKESKLRETGSEIIIDEYRNIGI